MIQQSLVAAWDWCCMPEHWFPMLCLSIMLWGAYLEWSVNKWYDEHPWPRGPYLPPGGIR